jgi:hypothetical protein
MADGHMVKPRQTSRDSLMVAAALAIGAAVAIGPDVAADKRKSSDSSFSSSSSSKSSTSSSSKRGRSDSSSNSSIRTQQLAGDALAEKLGASKPTSRPSESADDLRSRLSDVQDEINAEDERHAAALASLQKSSGSKARKAIDKENASHEQRRAALDEQRRSLLVKLNDGKASDATTEPAAPAPAAKKPAGKASTDARKR